MEFCPTCGNLLRYEGGGNSRFFCSTCPYVAYIQRQVLFSIIYLLKVCEQTVKILSSVPECFGILTGGDKEEATSG